MRYYGGKHRQSSVIIKHLKVNPKENAFYDLFCGALSVTVKVTDHFNTVTANDLTPLLIGYEFLIQNPNHVLNIEEAALARNDTHHPLHYIYATGASYGGKYQLNPGSMLKPRDNTSNRDYYRELNDSIRNKLRRCDAVRFLNMDYRDVELIPNSVVFMDPPYQGTEHYYGVDCSGFDYVGFWDHCRSLSRQGHRVYVTSVVVPDDFKVLHDFGNTNAMSTYKTVMEKLVVAP